MIEASNEGYGASFEAVDVTVIILRDVRAGQCMARASDDLDTLDSSTMGVIDKHFSSSSCDIRSSRHLSKIRYLHHNSEGCPD